MKTKAYVGNVDVVNGHDAWALFKASAAGERPKVEALLGEDPQLVNAQYWYQFPIHMAVREGHADIVELLLRKGADPGQSTFTYNSWDKLLQTAEERGHGKVAAHLRRAMEKRFHYSPDFAELKNAILARAPTLIETMLRERPELARQSDALGNNALHWSVLTRQAELLPLFVERGTPLDARRADGQTPLLLAVNGATDYWFRDTRGRTHPSLRNHWVLAGSLLALGAGYTLSAACAVGDQHRVEELLAIDDGLARRLDTARRSPLSYAAVEGHAHLVRLLLGHGADPNLPEAGAPDGLALFHACMANRLEVAALLLEHGANPNAGFDSSGCCLTIAAVYHGARARPLQTLLRQHGAITPPYAMTAQQMTQALRKRQRVVHHPEFFSSVLAKRNGKLLDLYLQQDSALPDRLCRGNATCPRSASLLRSLLEHGLDPNRTDWLGRTLLHACAQNGDRSVAAVLLKAGADVNARDLEFHGTPLASAVRSAAGQPPPRDGRGDAARRMVEFLLKRGAAPHLPDDKPWATPLAWATKLGREDLATVLKANGAR